jgi:Tfp pilus assembly PilM family ATPase
MRLPNLTRLRPPIRRVAVVDPGGRSLKLLLAVSDFGRLRIRQQELIDLKTEGLVSAEEIKTHLLATLDLWGSPPVALVLPQHLSTSQVIDVPMAPESEVRKLIEDETVRLGGVSESRIVYDFVRIETEESSRQQFWVTLCQEGEIRDRMSRLGIENEDICDVTTTSNALLATYRVNAPESSRAILVHMGAQSTVVVVVLAGQGAFTTSFQMGSDFFTRSLMRERSCSEESAETIKRNTNLFFGRDADPAFISTVDGWVAELDRQLKDWFERNPGQAANRAQFELVASGGGFDQPGLIEHLKQRAALNLQPWPSGKSSSFPTASKGFEIAYGAALQALGHSAQPVSLLPEDYLVAWKKRVARQRLEFASLLLVLLCVLGFAFSTWHNLVLIETKKALLSKIQAGQDAVEQNDALTSDLIAEYDALRPLFAAEQNTVDTLKTLSLLQQSRSNRSCWYVLIADQQSYFTQPLPIISTNTAGTNAVAAASMQGAFSGSWAMWTNISLAKPGVIAELCIPEEDEAARRLLGQIVGELQHQRLFAIADRLAEDQRRALADPKVVIADREFVLRLDYSETDFQKTTPLKRAPTIFPGRSPRRLRPFSSTPENAKTFPQSFYERSNL